MQKIAVIGCPGSGKSTFAKALHAITGIPLFHLDMLYWNADATAVPKNVFLERLNDAMEQPAWIIDGNYASTMETRLNACDTVFFLDYPTDICLQGAIARRGMPRSDMPWVEPTATPDEEFLQFIRNYQTQSRPGVLSLLEICRNKNVVIFNTREAANTYLNKLEYEKRKKTVHSNILFIGNSYTYYNDMPQAIFAPMAAQAGMDVQVFSVTAGGYRLISFADPADLYGQQLREIIKDKHFDAVILQDQSLITIQDEATFRSGIEQLHALLRQHADRFVLYATWGRKEGCPVLDQLGMTTEEMTVHIAEKYAQEGKRLGMSVANVGLAFLQYSKQHNSEAVYDEDMSHPSPLGSRVAAQTILDTLRA